MPAELTEQSAGACTIFMTASSARQDCACDAFGNCPEEAALESAGCVETLDMNQAFEDNDPRVKIVDHFDATSTGRRYVFGPEVQLNFSQIEIRPLLAATENGSWSLFK